MTESGSTIDHPEALDLFVRQTLAADGTLTTRTSVQCPARRHLVGLDDCANCGYADDAPLRDERAVVCHFRGGHRAESEAHPPPRGVARVLRKTPVAAIMDLQVICLNSDVPAEMAAALFLERGIDGAPVIDSDGRPVGMLSKTNFVQARFDAGDDADADLAMLARDPDLAFGFHAERGATLTVRDIMTPAVFTLLRSASVTAALELMANRRIHRVPVVSADGRVIGIVTPNDVIRWLLTEP